MTSIYLQSIEKELVAAPPERHSETIRKIAAWIAEEHEAGNRPQLTFICTHNSRRSQFAQAWCVLAQGYLGLDIADAWSGGTEITACNERTIAALKRAGCTEESEGSGNPVYTVHSPDSGSSVKLWSKVFDDETNPSGRFAAVMTCDHADTNCPFIPGATVRIPLTYTDPKYSDDTDEEIAAYDATCRIIAADMIRIFRTVQKLISSDTQ